MRFTLGYGKGKCPVEVPESVETEVIEPGLLAPADDLRETVLGALEKPVGSPPLRNLAPQRGEVAIVVSDKTRPCDYPSVLPILLDYLNSCGVPDKRMFLLVGYGAHKHHTEVENRLAYGEEVIGRLRLVHHDCRDKSSLTRLGKTSRGTEVLLSNAYLGAAMSLVVGSTSFHYFAGYGGGRKAVFPGVAGEDGILANHRILVESSEGSLAKMRKFKGNLESNPLNADLMEAVAMAPPSFTLTLCMNRQGKVSRVFAGDWIKSHGLGCEVLSSTRARPSREHDLVIASCGGYPKDVNFIQCHKTIDNAFDFVKPGGVLLTAGYCRDGIGSKSFLEWFAHGAKEMRRGLLERYSMNGGTALALRLKADACRIYLYSSLEEAEVRRMGLRPVCDLRQNIDGLIEEHGIRSAAILPDGNATVGARDE
jgi:nickel-dependent lactate racemase